MAIKLRAMTSKDYNETGGRVTQGYSLNVATTLENGLDSPLIFGKESRDLGKGANASRMHVRGYIPLERPILTTILTGESNKYLTKILGIKQEELKEILKFQKVFSVSEQRYIPVRDISMKNDKLLYGPEIIEYMIENLDLEKALLNELSVNSGLSIDYLNTNEKGLRIIGNIYSTDPNLTEERLEDLWDNKLVEVVIPSGRLSAFSVLYNMQDKERVRGYVTHNISVIPPELRPEQGGRKAPIMKYYSSLINKNNNLRMLRDAGPNEIVDAYRKLIEATNELLLDNKDVAPTATREVLKGKYGWIRNKMLGKRLDNSGRSVIIVDPELSVAECSLPAELIAKVYQHHILSKSEIEPSKLLEMSADKIAEEAEKLGILDSIPALLNRAPTLHTLSMQGYYTKVSDKHAIGVHPLICSAYNADFDGDAMSVHTPTSEEAVYEVEKLMLTTHNLFKPADGSCTIVPRQEMVYGLNVATITYEQKQVIEYSSLERIYDDLIERRVKVYDFCRVNNKVESAGKLAFGYCLPEGEREVITEVTSKTIKDYIEKLLSYSTEEFVRSIDLMTKLSFTVAKHYSPHISILGDIDSKLSEPFGQMKDELQESQEFFDLGFEDESSFNLQFNECLSRAEVKVKDVIAESVGYDNGFLRMIESGARGSIDNLVQIYSHKGQIQKPNGSAFNVVIENSFSEGLTPIQHFMSAYGTRKGLLDKARGPAKTGYMSRKLWHTAGDMIVNSYDCGTSEGLVISKGDLKTFILDSSFYDSMEDANTQERLKLKIQENFEKIVKGRYIAGTNEYITAERAKQLAEDSDINSIKIRTVLTCANPCCSKCYGDDLTIRGSAAPGLSIGFIAAQSVGEIGTQLTMRTFQKGGVAKNVDVTGSFDKILDFFHLSPLAGGAGKQSNKNFPMYDPIAWADGKINTELLEDNRIRVSIEGAKRVIKINANTDVKEYATKGEGIALVRGEQDTKELLKYAGLERAQLSWLYYLFLVYNDSSSINIKHFEVIMAAMTRYRVVDSEYSDIKIGRTYSKQELVNYDKYKLKLKPTLFGIKALPFEKNEMLSNILMEDIGKGLSSIYAFNLEDKFTNPLSAIAFGQNAALGTFYDNFIEDRLKEERRRL